MRYRWLRFLVPTLLALAALISMPVHAVPTLWQASMSGVVTHALEGNPLGATQGSAVSFVAQFEPTDPCQPNDPCYPGNSTFTATVTDFTASFSIGSSTYSHSFSAGGVLGGGDGTLPTSFLSFINRQLSDLLVQFIPGETCRTGVTCPAMTLDPPPSFSPVFYSQDASYDACLNDNDPRAVCGTFDLASLTLQQVPEPGTVALVGLALFGMRLGSRRPGRLRQENRPRSHTPDGLPDDPPLSANCCVAAR